MREDRNDYGFGTEDEPIGVVYSDRRRRWSHAWSEFAVFMLGLFGVIAVIGAARPFSWLRMAGAVGILAGAACISRSDKAHRSSTRRELVWAAVGLALAVGGIVVFLTS
jgi:hypothetical protein